MSWQTPSARRDGFGVSSHRAEHWWFMNGGMTFASDVQDPRYRDFYGPAMPGPQYRTPEWRSLDWQPRPDARFLDDWLARLVELVDKYRPQLVWFDWWIEQIVFAPYLQKFAAHYYNRGVEWGLGTAINFKNEAFPPGRRSRRGALTGGARCASGKRYVRLETHRLWESADKARPDQDLIDVVSKSGVLHRRSAPPTGGSELEPCHRALAGEQRRGDSRDAFWHLRRSDACARSSFTDIGAILHLAGFHPGSHLRQLLAFPGEGLLPVAKAQRSPSAVERRYWAARWLTGAGGWVARTTLAQPPQSRLCFEHAGAVAVMLR